MIQFWSENVIFFMFKNSITALIQASFAYSANVIGVLFHFLKKILNLTTFFHAWKVSAFGVILVHIFSNLDWIRENADQNNSKYGHFLRSVFLIIMILDFFYFCFVLDFLGIYIFYMPATLHDFLDTLLSDKSLLIFDYSDVSICDTVLLICSYHDISFQLPVFSFSRFSWYLFFLASKSFSCLVDNCFFFSLYLMAFLAYCHTVNIYKLHSKVLSQRESIVTNWSYIIFQWVQLSLFWRSAVS